MDITAKLKFLHVDQKAHTKGRLAVIDIGSSSVRLVVYEDVQSYPHLVLNQRVLSALGTGKNKENFKLCPERVDRTISAIKWFLWTAEQAGCTTVLATATAAVRDAENGDEFVKRVKDETGLRVEIISGDTEARLAAHGAMVSMPKARGVVLDLGSGSYEVSETHGEKRVESLPIGVLALKHQSEENPVKAYELATAQLSKIKWLNKAEINDIVALGSGMRSLARMHMTANNYPLATLHDYQVSADSILDFCKQIMNGEIAAEDNLNQVWADVLPYRAACLAALLESTDAQCVRFATFGIREGVLFTQTDNCPVTTDPLVAFSMDLAEREGRGKEYAQTLADWTKPLFLNIEERHLTAAAALAEIGWREQSVYRGGGVFRHVLGAGFVAIGHKMRAFLAAASYFRHESKIPQRPHAIVSYFLTPKEIVQARLVGAVFELAAIFDPGFSGALNHFKLTVDGNKFKLKSPKEFSAMKSEVVEKQLENLNKLLALYNEK